MNWQTPQHDARSGLTTRPTKSRKLNVGNKKQEHGHDYNVK